MDSEQPRLTIVYAQATRAELNQIWKYNEKTYGREHAADYINFLQDGIDSLATDPDKGKPVDDFPRLRALTLRRNARGEGQMAVYRVDLARQTIRILHVYHTSQDIANRLRGGRP